MTRVFLIALFCSLASTISYGQLNVSGSIKDSESGEAVPFVSVVIYQFQSNKIVTYTQSDQEGKFNLVIPNKTGVYTLKTSRLGYKKSEQTIAVASADVKEILVPISLSPDVGELKEVVIEGPIIVKEDTTIYDIEKFISARSENLEDVLAAIPGFKISADGTIQVEGKQVDKVLIDGKEVTGSGAAVITKSLAPEDVEAVEVRFDEKDDKLKESLLDNRKFVILDIKLKSDLKKSLFGKGNLQTGYRDQPEYGGYVNLFSLKKGRNIQFFAEHDRFGFETIPLRSIKNIGSDARSALFSIPADFESLTEKEDYNNQIFGFSDYTRAEKTTVGLSNFIHFSESLRLYFGSYSNLAKDGQFRNFEQGFTDISGTSRIEETFGLSSFETRNKAELRFDREKLKIKLDLNYTYVDQQSSTFNNRVFEAVDYDFERRKFSSEGYQNLLLEYKLAQRSGIRFLNSYTTIAGDRNHFLIHNDVMYANILVDDNSNPVTDFSQAIDSRASSLIAEGAYFKQSKIGTLSSGLRFQSNHLDERRTSRNVDSNVSVSAFSGQEDHSLNKRGVFLGYRGSLESLDLFAEATYTEIDFPTIAGNERINALEYVATIDYSFKDNSYFSLLAKKQIGSFALRRIIPGMELENFQSAFAPNSKILNPTPEYVFEISGYKRIASMDFEPAAIYGSTQQGNQFLNSSSRFVTLVYDQLDASYWAITLPLKKRLKKLPLIVTLEPEWLINQAQNIDDENNDYTVRTTRTLLGMKVNSVFEKTGINFLIQPKYTAFNFFNELNQSTSTQEMLSVNLSLPVDLFDQKLLLTPTLRNVRFFNNVRSEFTNIGLRATYKSGSLNFFAVADNLLNREFFVRQTLFPSFFLSENRAVFSRFVKVGVEFKVN